MKKIGKISAIVVLCSIMTITAFTAIFSNLTTASASTQSSDFYIGNAGLGDGLGDGGIDNRDCLTRQ